MKKQKETMETELVEKELSEILQMTLRLEDELNALDF